MLAQFAIFAFAILAVMTLVTDLGFVTLARVQMQNAADAAAMEGIRGRNAVDGDGYASDCLRRIAARDLVRWTFDDDFGHENTALDRQLGAGPRSDLVAGGQGDLDALGTLQLPDDEDEPRVYQPGLQFNQAANLAHGDMVSGNYMNGSYTDYDALPLPDEDTDYTQPGHAPPPGVSPTRENFTPNPVPPAAVASPVPGCPEPFAGSGPPNSDITDDAFLVRLRRTRDALDLDGQGDPADPLGSNGISSNGGSLPLLFGRGALLARDPERDYSVRRDGLTVRGAAVAQARPAVRVGRSGLTRFAIDLSLSPAGSLCPPASAYPADSLCVLESLFPVDTPVTATVLPDGQVEAMGPVPGVLVGRFVSEADTARLTTVGQSLPAPFADCDASEPTNVPNGSAWPVAVFQTVGATPRHVGFVPLTVFRDCTTPAIVALTRRSQHVASGNASALWWTGPADPMDPQPLPASDAPPLLEMVRLLANPPQDPSLPRSGALLLAPAVVR